MAVPTNRIIGMMLLLTIALTATTLFSGCGAQDNGACDGGESLKASDAAACRDATPSSSTQADAGPTSLYPQVAAILEQRCAIDRCHFGALTGGQLPLSPGADHRATLVGVPACEYRPMARVEPHHPERSWLMFKLTADFRPPLDPYATYIYFDPDPAWDPSDRGCPDETDDGTPLFGQRMPATAPNTLTPDELALIERWILQGAPP